MLVAAGAAGGLVAGIVGVGGGIIFAPVLFYYFQMIGLAPDLLTPTTVGTSLLCTTTASIAATWRHHANGSVDWNIAVKVGFASAAALFVVVRFVTTQPWYDKQLFQLAFGTLLLIVALKMAFFAKTSTEAATSRHAAAETDYDSAEQNYGQGLLIAIGSAAGSIAAAVGVGGGIVMVPAFHQLLGLPMKRSIGTSSGAIILISMVGVVIYVIAGWGTGGSNSGYVSFVHGLILALPAAVTAGMGANIAHRANRTMLRRGFAIFAAAVAIRMLAATLI